MKFFPALISFIFAIPSLSAEDAIDADRAATTVILDETAVRNLQIETVTVTEETFETTVFAVGRIEEIPANRSALSSRIAGRVVALHAYVGDTVAAGDVLAKVESRQPGDPPPTIELKALQGGLVVDSNVRIGEPVEPTEELLEIADRSRLRAVARIPEPEASGIVPGTKARIRVPALGGATVEATLKQFGVEANREAGTVEGIFELDNPDGRLQPGMRAEFSIVTGLRENIMAVPRSAIQGDPTRRIVFVEDFELPGAFVRVPVVLGELNETYIEVMSGLFPGDEVVTRGSYALSFAGSGSGMSLKEALDAAHGHEHNEDGSEITPEQLTATDTAESGSDREETPFWIWLVIGWAVLATIASLIPVRKTSKKAA